MMSYEKTIDKKIFGIELGDLMYRFIQCQTTGDVHEITGVLDNRNQNRLQVHIDIGYWVTKTELEKSYNISRTKNE